MLVSGGQNGILVYEWSKIVSLGAKLKVYSSIIFEDCDLNQCIARPDDTPDQATERFENQSIKAPKVTEIRFNPSCPDQLSLTGPFGALGVATVKKDSLDIGWILSKHKNDAPSMDLADITRGRLDPFRDHITWTGHAWTNLVKDDPKLLIACS
jgi:hypothetical protein